MANKPKNKPRTNVTTNTAFVMKKNSRSLNQLKFRKVILVLMALAFVVPIVAGLIIWFFYL